MTMFAESVGAAGAGAVLAIGSVAGASGADGIGAFGVDGIGAVGSPIGVVGFVVIGSDGGIDVPPISCACAIAPTLISNAVPINKVDFMSVPFRCRGMPFPNA